MIVDGQDICIYLYLNPTYLYLIEIPNAMFVFYLDIIFWKKAVFVFICNGKVVCAPNPNTMDMVTMYKLL